MRIVVSFIALVTLINCVVSNATPRLTHVDDFKTIDDRIRPFIDELVKNDQFSGVVLIAKGQQTIYQGAYGKADLANNKATTLDTKYNLASTTKSFTGVAVAQLAQAGKLSFRDPLGKFIPQCPEKLRDITIHQLLSHTGGTGDVIASRAFRNDPTKFKSLSDYIEVVLSEPLAGERGAFHYSDSGYVLLGAVIEKASGQSYYEYVKRSVFLPAGMKDSGFALIPRPTNLAIGYTSRDLSNSTYAHKDGSRQRNDSILPTIAAPSAAAYSTANDLMKFSTALHNHVLLNEGFLSMLFSGQIATDRQPPNQKYAYGFFEGSLGNTHIINQGGTGPGIDVGFDIFPDLGYTVVILSNYDPPAAQRIRDKLRSMIAE